VLDSKIRFLIAAVLKHAETDLTVPVHLWIAAAVGFLLLNKKTVAKADRI